MSTTLVPTSVQEEVHRGNLRCTPHYNLDMQLEALTLYIGPEFIDSFSKLLDRALNCNPEALPEWKHLSDMIKYGRMLQDYYNEARFHRTRSRTGEGEIPRRRKSDRENDEQKT